jgi:hypothetical protein
LLAKSAIKLDAAPPVAGRPVDLPLDNEKQATVLFVKGIVTITFNSYRRKVLRNHYDLEREVLHKLMDLLSTQPEAVPSVR